MSNNQSTTVSEAHIISHMNSICHIHISLKLFREKYKLYISAYVADSMLLVTVCHKQASWLLPCSRDTNNSSPAQEDPCLLCNL